MTKVNWTNPYGNRRGKWLKGNLHTHTTTGSGCARMSLADVLARYDELGYDFLSITDHKSLTAAHHRRMIFLPGIEWNSVDGDHTNICSLDADLIRRSIAITDQFTLLRRLNGKNAIVVLNHPNWMEPPHYSREQLLERKPAHGMEIYNGSVERAEGCAFATDKWDYLLSRERPILGFASDDSHIYDDIGLGWIMVRAASRSPDAVAQAIFEGNFYSSTGVTIRDIKRNGPVITVDTADAREIWAIGSGGARKARVFGKRMVLDSSKFETAYLRFVAFGCGAAMAWTQPFFFNLLPQDEDVSPFVAKWWMSGLEAHRLGNAPAVNKNSALDWKPIVANLSLPGFVCVTRHHGNKDGVVYFTNRFSVNRSVEWIINLGHDGGAALFVDGERVLLKPHRINPAKPDRSRARCLLTKGIHDITVCLDTDHGLGQGFFLRFSRPADGGKSARSSDAFPRCIGT